MTDIVKFDKDLGLEWLWLEFDADQSIRYHRKRAIFHKACKNINSFVIIFIGGTAFSGALTSLFDVQSAVAASALGFVLAFTGALDYIVGFGEQYKYHSMKRSAYSEIYKNIITKSVDEKNFIELKTQYMDVFAEEEGHFRVVDMEARNEVIVSRDLDRAEMVEIPWLKRIRAPFVRFETYIPQKINHAGLA